MLLYSRIALVLVSLHFIEFAEVSIENRLWFDFNDQSHDVHHQGRGIEQVYHPHPQYYRLPSNVDWSRISNREIDFRGVSRPIRYLRPYILMWSSSSLCQ